MSQLGSRDTLHSESTISISHGDLQSVVSKFQPRVKVNTQPKDKLPASHAISVAAEGSINHDEAPNLHASNAKDLEGGPGLASLSTFDCPTLRRCSFVPTNSSSELLSQQTLSNRETGCFVYEEDFLFDAESLGRELKICFFFNCTPPSPSPWSLSWKTYKKLCILSGAAISWLGIS
ncbi:hypothetical protein IFM89_031977 [Coptis chinensis]|uniref:Uncharacterized protein n=1 Tax=Coptis chinensis TaxID=261450 RepID=A0A835HIB2_9MAGN|nr:hypothetical protein IFM89_031977 [Coptis chinensis]